MQNLSRFLVPKGSRDGNAIKVQLWWAVQATIFAWSPQVLYRWWASLLRLLGAKMGKNAIIRPSVEITYPQKLTLGDYAWVGDNVNLYTLGEIAIGAHSVISQKNYLCTRSHDHASQHFTINATPIMIGKECWLAIDVFIAPGATIGDGTVVDARSSVFKSLPANVVCRRNPAAMVRERVETE